MTIAVPEQGGGQGVVLADLNLDRLQRELGALIAADPEYDAYVVDGAGSVAAHSDPSLSSEGTDASALPQVGRALAGDVGGAAVEGRSQRGDDVYASAVRMEPPGWLVFVERPRGAALEAVSAAVVRTVIFLLLSLALAAAAAALLARRMVRPVRAIQAGAARIGAGDLAERIEVRTGTSSSRWPTR